MARATDPDLARREATAVVRTLRDAGYAAYFAGGCVRDELLGQHPTDYDVATDAVPDQVRRLFRRVHEVGAAFGVMLIPRAGATIEVATFRAEGVYSDRRRPDRVEFTSAERDAHRRDFTINALFLDPLAEAQPLPASLPAVPGRVIDHVGGVPDLIARRIRAVGDPDARLAEDHLRALRAVRFAARLGFEVDAATGAAIRRHALELAGVSRERIGEELRRMLGHPARARAAALLAELGLDVPVLGPAPTPPRTPVLLGSLGHEAGYALALAAWALDRHADPGGCLSEVQVVELTGSWRARLCLSNADRDLFSQTLRAHAGLHGPWWSLPLAAQKRAAGRAGFRQALAIRRAQAAPEADRVATHLAAHGVDLTRPPPDPLVTGDDLIAMGLSPSPLFKRVLEAVYDAQLDGTVGTKDQAMELARRLGV